MVEGELRSANHLIILSFTTGYFLGGQGESLGDLRFRFGTKFSQSVLDDSHVGYGNKNTENDITVYFPQVGMALNVNFHHGSVAIAQDTLNITAALALAVVSDQCPFR